MDRKNQPYINTIDQLNELHSEVHHLDNDIPVYQIQTGTQDLLKIEFVFKAGTYYQPKKLVASITNKLLAQGTKSFSAFEIAEQIDTHGAFLDSHIDKDRATIALYSLNKHLDKLLPLLNEIINKPVFPEKEFNVLLNKTKQEYFINLEKVKFLAAVNFNKLIYGQDHPYGIMIDKADFENIGIEDIKQFYQNYYKDKSFKIIVSGKTPKGLTKNLNAIFGLNTRVKKIASPPYPFENYQAGQHKIVKQGSLQSAIRIGKPLFNRLHPDYKKFSVLNTVLGGFFGSRLMTNIREEKGYTYGIVSSTLSLQHSGYFSIVTEVGSEFTDAAIEEIYKELQILRTKRIPDEELNLVKNYITGQIIRSLDGPFALAEKLRILIQYNLPSTYFQDYVREINNTNSEDLIQIANQYLSKDSLTELVVGS